MTNGHWEERRKKEAQAKILYAQGKTQEADNLLGKPQGPGYIYVKDRVPEPEPKKNEIVVVHEDPYPEGELMSSSEPTTLYYVKKPSGTCTRISLTPSSVIKARSNGWIVSLTDICEQEQVTPPSEPTPPILSTQIQKIIDDWHNHQLILPSWFANNNLNWVISGHITESEFLKGFNALLHEQIAYYVEDHHPVEEPDVPEQMEFLCSDVYTLDNGSVVKTNYPTLSVPQIQNFISQGLMVRDCGTPSPTVNEVRSHYGYVPEPDETVPTEKFVVSKPGRLTISDMTNTNAWVGVLFAGALAVPVFSSILSKRK